METYFNSHDHYLVEQVCDHGRGLITTALLWRYRNKLRKNIERYTKDTKKSK